MLFPSLLTVLLLLRFQEVSSGISSHSRLLGGVEELPRQEASSFCFCLAGLWEPWFDEFLELISQFQRCRSVDLHQTGWVACFGKTTPNSDLLSIQSWDLVRGDMQISLLLLVLLPHLELLKEEQDRIPSSLCQFEHPVSIHCLGTFSTARPCSLNEFVVLSTSLSSIFIPTAFLFTLSASLSPVHDIVRDMRVGDPALQINHPGDPSPAAPKFSVGDTKSSSSGTFLNHIRLAPAGPESCPYQLKDGDLLQMGVDYQGGSAEVKTCV
ncbi:hypothetical protein BDP27DRAFT_1426013 [Rhodocollybia butyracea]|uniref:FHA domain-containing protein n=1 Tax=Rhodocollybia butyracea TaxID=206335 RepID=A0A9P5PLK3_9AGAR|nr:hypothetical protein BDP27DRAFT_1426013 [Rhodocollybia butyracea]